MPLFATFLPKRARLANWGSYIRSMRSRLLRTNNNSTHGTKATGTDTPYGNVSDRDLARKDASYVELHERKSNASSARNNGKREWFDAQASLMQETDVDRTSRDVTQLVLEMEQQQQQQSQKRQQL
jgi:hypothetical protein